MKQLTISDLIKYDWRIENFLRKYRDQEPFELMSGTKVKLVYDQETDNIISTKKYIKFTNLKFVDSKIKSKTYRISSFKMTPEFGGKPDRPISFHDDKNIHSINTQFDAIRSKTGQKFIPIRIDNHTYDDITECERSEGKANISFKTLKGDTVLWVSHKSGTRPADYEMWSTLEEQNIVSHPETQDFIKNVEKKYPKMPAATCIGRKIDDYALANYAVYGHDYNIGKHYSQNNVQLVIGGEIRVFSDGNHYGLRGNRIYYNGDIVFGSFTPTLIAMFSEGQSEFNVLNARFMILPQYAKKVTEWL